MKKNKKKKKEVEWKAHDAILAAMYSQLDIIMLDNIDIAELEKSVKAIRSVSIANEKHIRIEVSGNITKDNIREIAEKGVDYISIGSLTHSVVNHDFTLLFNEM